MACHLLGVVEAIFAIVITTTTIHFTKELCLACHMPSEKGQRDGENKEEAESEEHSQPAEFLNVNGKLCTGSCDAVGIVLAATC